MTVHFPRLLLRERAHSWNLSGVSATPGDTASSVSVLTRSDGGGFWKCAMQDVSLSGGYPNARGNQRQRLSTLLWRALRQICDGGAAPIVVYRNDTLFRPWPAGLPQSTAIDTPHSDVAYFGDGTGYYQSTIDIVAGPAALRATTMDIAVNYASQLVGGESFSIEHDTMDWRLYEIATISIDTRTVGDSATKILMHFDGEEGTTSFIDSSLLPKTFTASGNAQIDTTFAKFGPSSGAFDGVSTSYITTPDHADFTLGANDFTIDCWFLCNAAGGTIIRIAGQCDSAVTEASASFKIRRTSGNFMEGAVSVAGVATAVTGTTQYTNAVNTGWHHLAFVRTGNVLKLFIDGTQQGGNVAFSGTVNDSSQILSIGNFGASGSNVWNGSIDEFRMSVGVARWTANFTPPTSAYNGTASITFRPPLREAITGTTRLEFDRPRCKMRLANPASMDLAVQPWTFNSASVDFVESP